MDKPSCRFQIFLLNIFPMSFQLFLQTSFFSNNSFEKIFDHGSLKDVCYHRIHRLSSLLSDPEAKKASKSSLKQLRDFLWFFSLFFRDWFWSLNVPHYSCLWHCCLLDRKIFSSLMNVFNDQLKGYIKINTIKEIRAFNLKFICRNWTIWLICWGFSCARNRSSSQCN